MLQAAHISDDEYFNQMVRDDLNLIIRDIREAHKKDSESAPQTTVADELKENGNTYQPEEKTVKKNRCCMVCWLPCSSGFCWDYSVEFLERQTEIAANN